MVAVVTGAEVNAGPTPLRMAPPIEGLHPVEFTTLPTDKVRFQGDPVVCVVATDRYLAEDAAELVEIDYEPLPVVASYAGRARAGRAAGRRELPSNLVSHQSFTAAIRRGASPKPNRIVEAVLAAPPDPSSDRDPRLPRDLGRGPPASDLP